MQRTEKYFERDAFRTESEGIILAAEADAKTGGGFLSGIVGFLLSYLLLFAAAGLVIGTAVRWLSDRLNPGPAKPSPAHAWDLWLIGGLSLAAILASAAE